MTARRNLPDFFIVGAPKCGTTSMARWLTAHPEMFVLRGEPHYFGSDIAYNRPRLSYMQYRALCRAAGPVQRLGDRSTWSLFSTRAAEEIHAVRPDARIIAMVRDPAEMIHSLHAHHVLRGQRDDCIELEQALAREPLRRTGRCVPSSARFAESLFYTAVPRYAEQLERYCDRFGRSRVHIVVFDELRERPERTYQQVLDFLDVDPGPAIDFRIHNAAGPSADDWLHRAWKRSLLRYRIRSLAPEWLYARLRARPRRAARAAADRSAPPLSESMRQTLDTALLPEVRKLERLLGRALPNWAASARGASSPRSAAPTSADARL